VSYLIDTSVLVHLLRDRSGDFAARYDELVAGAEVALSRITEYELLRGAKSEKEWNGLKKLVREQALLPIVDGDWHEGARIVFDLRRRGVTLGNSIDCVIAQAALRGDLTVLHDDEDFERIARVRELKVRRLQRLG